MKTKLTDGMRLYCCSMGKVFRVTHICDTAEEANSLIEKNNHTALIACDESGRHYLAEQYGSIAPSAIMDDMRRDRSTQPENKGDK